MCLLCSNSLSNSLCHSSLSTDSFLGQLKTFLFSNYELCIKCIRIVFADVLYKSTFYLLRPSYWLRVRHTYITKNFLLYTTENIVIYLLTTFRCPSFLVMFETNFSRQTYRQTNRRTACVLSSNLAMRVHTVGTKDSSVLHINVLVKHVLKVREPCRVPSN